MTTAILSFFQFLSLLLGPTPRFLGHSCHPNLSRLFTMQHFLPTIDETSRLATAGLVTSTRALSYVG